ncbi:LuxR C-terminal-related transcriptional regulator [Pseudomonas sp. BJa5]|uniref:LuxR C-terminal-related transcriptional regulator n=1 Tax=Pseudomonas sp. BJa5 TaxID=2936270 RepID=UPI002559CABF|nr:LuxR C-terminal-related transcriptional regulator [Pseudomonas sp. BGr12]MDL2424390.1 LuxR C-terminal-related transcriptional regulator [Pseudomonas sp. BGr12]
MSTVLVVDQLPIVRDGLRAVLERAGHQVLAEVDNGQDALLQCRQLHPELVILELLVPRLGGLDLLRRLRASHAGLKLLVYSVQEAGLYAARSLQAGADAYVCKTDAVAELERAVQAVSHGRSYFPREATRQEAQGPRSEVDSELAQLSGRELTVLQMLSQGLNNKDIAEQLSLSYKTVSTYKARLHQKLNVGNDFQLLEVARSHGLVAGEDGARTLGAPTDPQLLREYGLLRGLLDAAPYPMFVRDLEGRLLMCNRRYLALVGESFEVIRGTTLEQAKWLPPHVRVRSQMRFKQSVRQEEPVIFEAVVEYLGVPTAMYGWCTPFRDEAGQLVAMLGGMRDLTERDSMLARLRHEGAEARFESHLKSSTLAAISQELQALLAVMQQSLDGAGAQQLVGQIDSMRQCLVRVDELWALDAHRQETITEAHHLGTLTERILVPLRQHLEAKGCQLDLGPALHTLKSAWIDARHYRQLLESLFGYLRLGTLPPRISLRLTTNLQPRGLLRLCLELSPWHEPDLADASAQWAHASLQRLLLLLQASAQTVASGDGEALAWRLELDLPQALTSP